MFTYFIENNLISENQSGFILGDSCVNQSLAITGEMFPNFDEYHEVREVFLEISNLSIKCGTSELFINLNATGSEEIY